MKRHLKERSQEFKLREEYTKSIFDLIIKETCYQESILIENFLKNKDK
ncbi:Similar to papb protein and to chorismate mutase/prephenat dehydrogenase (fragment) [Xenorhabdus doucetiae]|uniref:Chorismate mutase n=1 Tax=Xenorhabdus doucetiae TaxID=351671 RepID=A0A068QVN1_9GAMM